MRRDLPFRLSRDISSQNPPSEPHLGQHCVQVLVENNILLKDVGSRHLHTCTRCTCTACTHTYRPITASLHLLPAMCHH